MLFTFGISEVVAEGEFEAATAPGESLVAVSVEAEDDDGDF